MTGEEAYWAGLGPEDSELSEDERDDFLEWLNEGEEEFGDELPPIESYDPPPPSDEL